jgi:uncharacterized membrane protein YdjX (TVP38/TMEM64 family)
LKSPLHEVEQLWVDSIATARDFVYIETPFFTSRSVTAAMRDALRRPDGPEIVVVTAARESGWIEKHTMTVLRDRRISELQVEDPHGRLHVYVPMVPRSDGESEDVKVHAKVCVVDGRIARVGSANVTERSMGLDRETDLVVCNDAGSALAWRLVGTLVGEHLGRPPDEVVASIRERGLVRTIESNAHEPRRLRAYEPQTSELVDHLVPRSDLVDPPAPPQPTDLMQLLSQPSPADSTRWRWTSAAWWGAALLFVVAARAFDLLTFDDIVLAMARFGDPGVGSLLAVTGLFVGAGLMFVPLTLLLVNAGLMFGPKLGLVYGLVGTFVGAAVFWWLGRRLSQRLVEPLVGPRIRGVMTAVAERGILAVAALRLVPVAPHVVIGLLAGGSRISFRDYMLGSIIGMGPGIVVLVWLGDAVSDISSLADVVHLWPAAVAAVVSLLVAWGLTRLVSRRPAS